LNCCLLAEPIYTKLGCFINIIKKFRSNKTTCSIIDLPAGPVQ
jgi:hypothetical protein